MEPQQTSPEQPRLSQPEQFAGSEHLSAMPEREQHVAEHIERRPGVAEASAQVSSAMPVAALPTPVAQDDTSTPTAANDNPIVAADEDLIEKEWVDRAKQVIAQTKDDPYRREQEIKALKIDYVQKRYGKTIGATND